MKFNIKLLLLSCFFGFSLAGSFTNSTDYVILNNKLEDVKKFPIIACSEDSQCPSYSKGCVFDIEIDAGVCDMDIFCNRVNGCVALLENFDPAKSSNLIIDSYQTAKDKKNKLLPQCKSDSDCFSNKCSEGTCLVDDNDQIYNCVVAELGVHQSHINCALAANQICYDHLDCISNQCFDVCDGDYYNHTPSGASSSSQSFAKIMVAILLLLSLLLN